MAKLPPKPPAWIPGGEAQDVLHKVPRAQVREMVVVMQFYESREVTFIYEVDGTLVAVADPQRMEDFHK